MALLSRFLRNCDGGAAPMLALAALPLFGFVGAAVDFGRAATVRTAMLAALDSTALMLSKDAKNLSSAEMAQKASEYFQANFNQPASTGVQITHQFTVPQEGSFSLKITGATSVKTVFAKLLGTDEIAISASAEVLWGMKKLELVLVLDNTGSMSSNGKMSALKTASKNLLTTLKNAEKEPGDVKVAIVPFATDVNAGTANKDAAWIDWADWEAANGTCSVSSYKSKSSCESNGKTWTPASHDLWNGCVYDRDQHNDVKDTAPVQGNVPTLFRAHQAANCPVSTMALSNDWTALNAKVDAMTPAGNTNTTIGLAWGFQHLSPGAPFHASPAKPNLDKVIVLLTDGENTQNRWTTSSSSINSRTEKACDNIKAANIKLYTVRVINGNGTLLKNCATKPDMYYDVDEAVQLNSVFGSIAQNLANLRIAK